MCCLLLDKSTRVARSYIPPVAPALQTLLATTVVKRSCNMNTTQRRSGVHPIVSGVERSKLGRVDVYPLVLLGPHPLKECPECFYAICLVRGFW